MKPMLLTAADEIPISTEWRFEGKYDGFRCVLEWVDEPILKSRNGNILNAKFPEIISFCNEISDRIKPYLPLMLDGELVYLMNNFQSNFSVVQTRGRMRSQSTIKQHASSFPCHYVVFDYMKEKGDSITNQEYTDRKEKLSNLFKGLELPLTTNYVDKCRMQLVEVFEDSQKLYNLVKDYNGEGIVAKRELSQWKSDTRSPNWVKIKNWRYVSVILTKYNKENGFFHGAVYKNDVLIEVVSFRHGLSEEEFNTLVTLFIKNGKKITEDILSIDASICVEVACIDFAFGKLREPRFYKFNFDKQPEDCSWQNMQRQLNPLLHTLEVTHPDKPIWPASNIQKDDYLLYLQHVAPYMLPFLRDRLLTVIRYPHGVPGESFYQKNSPDYVPDFVTTKQIRGKNYIICNDLETLLWLGNQLAIEFHIPFNTINTNKPTEIVFDLDPPSLNEFSIATEAALRLKTIFNQLGLQSFPKTSGGKGIHVYIPLPFDMFTYDDTHIFSEFLCEQEPRWYTTERLKKNRNNRLYLDYVQHKTGNTLAAPYSPRGNEKGLISTPLDWEEVNDSLTPTMFTIPAVIERIQGQGNPFNNFIRAENSKQFANVLSQLKKK
ncbi:DNA ligase D [Viridibacillus sp. FSL H7-0596]|uniref:ATP-dependent DNA ligase n=2 Tax=Caryophanaceae TaxID=186818 RepID=W4EKG0_9BACL|nr:ATP-dependent DNA ligase [Viridibacillus arenosi FSL R5-213]OMC88520.1 DNA ligase D [Viridibacillus sp. FSL H7-0596]OMC93155.1 DNA ligase D [Viridibacillus arenosi]